MWVGRALRGRLSEQDPNLATEEGVLPVVVMLWLDSNSCISNMSNMHEGYKEGQEACAAAQV